MVSDRDRPHWTRSQRWACTQSHMPHAAGHHHGTSHHEGRTAGHHGEQLTRPSKTSRHDGQHKRAPLVTGLSLPQRVTTCHRRPNRRLCELPWKYLCQDPISRRRPQSKRSAAATGRKKLYHRALPSMEEGVRRLRGACVDRLERSGGRQYQAW